MNTKTTLTLAFSLVVLVLLYYAVQSRNGAADTATASSPPAASATTRDLLETKLGDVVNVVCKNKDGEEWVFERDEKPAEDGQNEWRMTSPLRMPCARWELDKFASQLGSLKYEVSYRSGEAGGVTAKEAGLDPPETVVTLTDADGRSATIEIGNPASARATYVRLAGSDEICVGQSDLRNLVKDKALDYRDKQLWEFKPQDVKRVEIVDRTDRASPVSYAFARDGTDWLMLSPVSARATSKVDDMLSSLSRLRAIAWLDDRAESLPMYGLSEAALTLSVTVDEEIPVQPAEPTEDDHEGTDDDEMQAKTETKVTTYVLHVSDQSPIGEDTKTYMRVGDESAVATVNRSVADKFRPDMTEWRDMRLTPVDVTAATRIELTTREGSMTLVKTNGEWSFDADGGRAEASAVTELLSAVGNLKAVAFVDDAPADLSAFGLKPPKALVRLSVPGVESDERIAVGDYTDQQAKRLVYVRRSDVNSVGKVRAADVAKLTRGPQVYRDRAIVDVLPSRFEKIAILSENRFDGGRNEYTLEREGNTWSMVAPVRAEVRTEQMDKLVEALGGLRAEQVVSDGGDASAYGLHAPVITLTLTHKPPVEYRIDEPSDDEAPDDKEVPDGDDDAAKPVEIQPPSESMVLSVARHDGKYYAKRADRGTIYRVSEEFFNNLVAEYRSDRILDFDVSSVREFSIRNGDKVHVFANVDDRWVYQAEPDLPLDGKKVENLLLQARDLRAGRFIRHSVDDLSQYGLTSPPVQVSVSLEDGTQLTLSVSGQQSKVEGEPGFYASKKSDKAVFLVPEDAANRLEVSLDELEAMP